MFGFPLVFTYLGMLGYNRAPNSFQVSIFWPSIWMQRLVHKGIFSSPSTSQGRNLTSFKKKKQKPTSLSTVTSFLFFSENDSFLGKPYYAHKGPFNYIFLFGASHTMLRIITTKPKFVCLLRTVFKVIPPTMSKNANSCC